MTLNYSVKMEDGLTGFLYLYADILHYITISVDSLSISSGEGQSLKLKSGGGWEDLAQEK